MPHQSHLKLLVTIIEKVPFDFLNNAGQALEVLLSTLSGICEVPNNSIVDNQARSVTISNIEK